MAVSLDSRLAPSMSETWRAKVNIWRSVKWAHTCECFSAWAEGKKKKKGLEKENWSLDSNETKYKEVKSRQLNFHYKHWPVLISLTKPDIISPALHRTEQKFLLKAHHTSQHARVVAHLWGNSSPATLSHFALQQTCFWHFSFPTTPHYSHEERTNKGDHLFPQPYTPMALAETQCTPKKAATFFLSKTQ